MAVLAFGVQLRWNAFRYWLSQALAAQRAELLLLIFYIYRILSDNMV